MALAVGSVCSAPRIGMFGGASPHTSSSGACDGAYYGLGSPHPAAMGAGAGGRAPVPCTFSQSPAAMGAGTGRNVSRGRATMGRMNSYTMAQRTSCSLVHRRYVPDNLQGLGRVVAQSPLTGYPPPSGQDAGLRTPMDATHRTSEAAGAARWEIPRWMESVCAAAFGTGAHPAHTYRPTAPPQQPAASRVGSYPS